MVEFCFAESCAETFQDRGKFECEACALVSGACAVDRGGDICPSDPIEEHGEIGERDGEGCMFAGAM